MGVSKQWDLVNIGNGFQVYPGKLLVLLFYLSHSLILYSCIFIFALCLLLNQSFYRPKVFSRGKLENLLLHAVMPATREKQS